MQTLVMMSIFMSGVAVGYNWNDIWSLVIKKLTTKE